MSREITHRRDPDTVNYKREFITSDQWVERVEQPGSYGYKYYDGVHRGFASACDNAWTLEPTRWAEARDEALAALSARRAYARGR